MKMSVYIEDCFHWIGYHLVTVLLEEGWIVYGRDRLDAPNREHLSMFVGRNSHFSLLDDEEGKQMHPRIEISDDQNGISITTTEGEKIVINCSPLIGEWMPMTATHMLNGDKLQPWKALDLKEIIEVSAYAEILKQCLQATRVPRKINIVSRLSEKAGEKNPNMIVSIDQKDSKEALRSLKEHFNRFKPLYQEVAER